MASHIVRKERIVHDGAVVVRPDVGSGERVRVPIAAAPISRIDVLSEHSHVAVTILALLFMPHADGVAQLVERYWDGATSGLDRHNPLTAIEASAEDAETACLPDGEPQVVPFRCPLHESDDGLIVPYADRLQYPLAFRNVVVDHVRDDPSRP